MSVSIEFFGIQIPQFDSALCAQVDPELFFPEQGEGDKIRAAKAICKGCTHKVACLETALTNNDDFGLFGGLSAVERERIRSKQFQEKKARKSHSEIGELHELGLSNEEIAMRLGYQIESVERFFLRQAQAA